SDYGVPTIRKRLFLIARCDGLPIIWPEPTHADPKKIPKGSKLKPWRTAAECIDWNIPCKSIFERKTPLKPNTLRRIAKGIQKFVIDAEKPFILNITHGGRIEPLDEPLRTITCAKRGEKALIVPQISRMFGNSIGSDVESPIGTVTAGDGGKTAMIAAFLAQHNTQRKGVNPGRPADEPLATIVSRGTQTQLVAAHIMKMYGTTTGSKMDEPLHTVSAGGLHHAEVRAFLIKYYGASADGQPVTEPLHSVTAKPRFGLVTIRGEEYAIVDIGMRMLTPRELYRAQGFPEDYIIDRKADGTPLNKTSQIRMCGNSVCPPLAAAIIRANVRDANLLQKPVRKTEAA
ncbi:MAG: cytosine-specific methylase, partial [Micavibrio sp.]|nr:cytosine-specific methylase [Micavibrio sp.]